ncbi:MAG: hypothetical protein FWF59_09820 [Turicibacter sp.]|nr:hypothetical protein [Turicibacter sp.]
MRKKLGAIIGVILLLGTFLKVSASDRPLTLKEQEYISKIQLIDKEIEKEMYYDMRDSSGDVNYEFLMRLQALQRVILTTAKAEERYGQDALIKKYANQIIEDKQHYMEKIDALIPTIQEGMTDDKLKEGKYSTSYGPIYKKLTRGSRPIHEVENIIRDKGVDREFLGRIILQEEAMSDMLTLIHNHTHHQQVIDLVESIAQPHQEQLEDLYKLVGRE